MVSWPHPLSVHSAAILRYLVAKHDLPDHWYPTDIQQRAKVNQYLSWHISNLRVGAAGTLFLKVWYELHILSNISYQNTSLYLTVCKSVGVMWSKYLVKYNFKDQCCQKHTCIS